MAEYTRPASWEDVKTLARLLNDSGADYALVGGYAMAAHGFVRQTEDIDILVSPDVNNSRRWILALGQLPDHAAQELVAEADVFSQDQRYAIRINDEFTIDVLPSIAGYTWEAMRPYIEAVDIDGVSVKLLNLRGLLLSKQGVRPKDQADAAVLRAALERLEREGN